jgi:TPR repeat protein
VTTSRSVKRPEIPASIDLFRRACNAKHTRGCTVLAEKMFAGSDTPKDPAGAVKLWEQSCADSDTYACSDLAELYFDGNTVAQDRARAVAMFDKACASSPPTYAACARLGLAYDKGLGVPKNAAKGWDLLRTSCEYGSIASACTRVGEIQESQGHLDRAFDHYARACSANDAGGCIGLASVQVKKGDAAKALGVLRRTCVDQRLGQACALGGIWNANGEHGLAKNATLAAELYARGCELGDGDSCNLGGQFADAQQDYARARRLLARACELDEASACNFLGKELEAGLGGPVDEPAALATYQRACDIPPKSDKHGPQAYGCAHEGLLARKLGAEARAVARLRKACDWENQTACAALGP